MSTSKSVNTEHRTQLFIYVSEFVRFHSIFIFFGCMEGLLTE